MLSVNLSILLYVFGDVIFNNVFYFKFILIFCNYIEKLIGIL